MNSYIHARVLSRVGKRSESLKVNALRRGGIQKYPSLKESFVSRTRKRGGFTAMSPIEYYGYPTSCSNHSWYRLPQYDVVPMKIGRLEFMTDVVIPNFRKRVAEGQLFFNDMRYESLEVQASGSNSGVRKIVPDCSPPVNLEYMHQGPIFTAAIPQSDWGGYSNVPVIQFALGDGEVSNLRSEVSTKLLAQRGHSDSNLWESLAEANQVISMLDRPISKLTQTFRKAAKAKRLGRFTGFTVDGVSNLWLMYRYGISPALNDINSIMEGLRKKTSKQRLRSRAKGSLSATKNTTVLSTVSSHSNVTASCSIIDNLECRAFSVDEYTNSFWENVGFSQKGLITLPWELIQFSFVYDWFLNIGDFLNAQVPAFEWNQLGSGLVTKRTVTNIWTVSGGSPPSGYTSTGAPSGSAQVLYHMKSRTALAPPSIVIKSDFRFNKFNRTADALALLAQLGKSVFGRGG